MSLKDDKQQNIQMQLDFSSVLTGEAREAETTDRPSRKRWLNARTRGEASRT